MGASLDDVGASALDLDPDASVNLAVIDLDHHLKECLQQLSDVQPPNRECKLLKNSLKATMEQELRALDDYKAQNWRQQVLRKDIRYADTGLFKI